MRSCKVVSLGMQNSVVTRRFHSVRLTLEPLSCNSNKSVIILTHGVDWIADIEPRDLSSVRSQPFLHGKRLADSELVRFGKVGILLGIFFGMV